MRRFDVCNYAGEADMLECRLVELEDAVDHVVIVEADVTYGHNEPKPYHFLDQRDRFERWKDRIEYVQATGLPDTPDPWDREHAQREWMWKGLESLGAEPDDIVLQSDIDEIPTALAAKYVQPKGFVVFLQRFHTFAVDWLHPTPWQGTVAARVKDIDRMTAMRDTRLFSTQQLPDAGWHFSWVYATHEEALTKMRTFSHPEIADTWTPHLADCRETGLHVDGQALEPVEIDDLDYPKWITEGHAPEGWFRPRGSTKPRPVVKAPDIVYGCVDFGDKPEYQL